jgi:hypothetical protein
VTVEVLPAAPDTPYPLGRNRNWDPRNRRYAFLPEPARPIRSVEHHRHVPAYTQRVGSCVINAVFGLMSTRPDRHRYRSQNNIERWYADVTHNDPFDGAWNWPARDGDDTGTDATSACNLLLARGRISRFEHVFTGLPGVLAALQDRPVAVGMWWRDGMWATTADGQLRVSGPRVGGHEVYLSGVDVDRRRVWGWNSWGAGFGLVGRFWMSFDDAAGRLDEDGDATILYPA